MASTGNTSSEKKRTTQSRRTASQQRTAASKPAASKGTRTSASRSSSKKRKKKKVNSASFTEAALFIALAVALILFISNFGLAGKAGTFFAAIQFGTFGIFAYIFPVVLVVGTVIMLRKGKNSGVARVKFITAFIGAMFVCAFIEMVGGGYIKLEKLSDYYNFEVPLKKGGGIVGGAVCSFLTPAVGKVGTYIIIIVFIIIAVLIISERSIIRSLTNGSRKVINTAKDDINEYKEESEKKRAIRQEQRELKEEQQRQRRRFDQKVSGVDLSIEIPGTNRRNDILGPKQPEAENMRTSAAGRLSGPDVAEVFQNDRYSENIIEIDSDENSDESTGGIFNLPKSSHSKRDKSVAAKSNDIGPVVSDKDKSARAADDSLFARGYDKQEEYHDIHGDDSSAYADEAYTEADYADEAYRKESVDDDLVDDYADYSQEQTSYRNESADSDYAYGEHLQELPEDDGLEQWQRQEKTDAVGRTVLEGLQKQTPGTGTKHDSAGTGGADKMGTSSSASARGAQPEKTMEQVDAEIDEEVRHSEQLSEEIVEKPYEFPPVELLHRGKSTSSTSQKELRDTAVKLQQTLSNFGVRVTVSDVSCGPAVTRYEIQPEQGVKVSRIVSLADDIKLNLAAADIRIEAPIPGKAAVGIEVPNKETSGVTLRELIESKPFEESKSPIAFGVGKDIAGQVVVADIAKMPHVLIAGATGSGKSVCINTIIMSILYRAKPSEVKLIMIDPKVVELSVYNGIPHLMIPVVTDSKKAAGALNWAVAEMDDRYKKFAQAGVRDLKGYNAKVEQLKDIEAEDKPAKLPQLVIIIDELADLMMIAKNEVEDAIVRLAQLARAAGIHLVIATQRPSVDVITGLIKANVPSRIAFAVSSGVDSRTILDMVGAEKLLGKGDMLFSPAGYPKPARIQGAFVSDDEVSAVVEFLKANCGESGGYHDDVARKIDNPAFAESQAFGNDYDDYFAEAGRYLIEKGKGSVSILQRVYRIGFNRAARIMDQLEEAGVMGPEEGTKPRKVLMTMDEFEELLQKL
ncbi:MAG TPA: cell division protein FtsK [Eubacterium sp.]|nr:cell division protein FtsK [Eubacterium sp.]